MYSDIHPTTTFVIICLYVFQRVEQLTAMQIFLGMLGFCQFSHSIFALTEHVEINEFENLVLDNNSSHTV